MHGPLYVYDVQDCLLCKLKQSEWVSHHGKKENGMIKCHAPFWNKEELILHYIDTQVNQQNVGGKNSDGVRCPPHHSQKEVQLFSLFPIKNAVIPMLIVLLGLGNYLISYFWKYWFDERIGPTREHRKYDYNDVWLSSYSSWGKTQNITIWHEIVCVGVGWSL